VRLFVSAAFVILSSIVCPSQESKQLHDCFQKEMSQTGMDHCASDEAARADSELNSVYQRLLSKAERVPGASEKIKDFEKAWIKYRDAYIEAMYPEEDKQAAYGTVYPMEVDLLIATLTRKHTEEIQDLIKQYDEETF
jgi:uncharacterized protein YecT (DUF1311 family)